jgi:tetratricopeptide (TPR) repeat protein
MRTACPDDATIAAHLARELDSEAAAAIARHLDECEDCHALVVDAVRAGLHRDADAPLDPVATTIPAPPRAVPARPPGPSTALLGPGTRIDRYVIEGLLGAGGMGVVYDARDTELDRPVALKLLRIEHGPDAPALAERLARESKLMAKARHPSVLTVFDAGRDGDRVYVAMERIDGGTLGAWMRAHPRPWRELLAVFRRAGEGLAAAHRAGLVHRDFKPENVLLELVEDRPVRVLVTDFGVARVVHGDEPRRGGPDAPTTPLQLTATGAAIGTPAYMAPEQLSGERADARSDVFAFAVSVWEGLWGARPFEGRSVAEIRAAMDRGPPVPASVTGEGGASGRIPRWVSRELRRALDLDPSRRPPTMEKLLRALDPPRRTRLWTAIGVAALVAVAAVTAVLVTRSARVDACRGADRAIDGAWTTDRRDAVRAALSGLGGKDQGAVADAVVQQLDQRAARWRTMRLDVCEASRVREDEDQAVTARRAACLDRSLEAMRASVDLLADRPSRAIAANALAITRSGQAPGDCTAAGTLGGAPPAHAPPELTRALADLVAHDDAGDDVFVLDRGPDLATKLEAAGDADGAAETLYRVALAGHGLASAKSTDLARHAAQLAAKAGDDDLGALAWGVAAQRAADAGDLRGVDDFLTLAQASAAKSPRPSVGMLVDIARAFVEKSRGHVDVAEKLCTDVYQRGKAVYGPTSATVVGALGCLFNVALHRDDFTSAARYASERAELAKQLDGEQSANYRDAAENEAIVVTRQAPEKGAALFYSIIDEEARIYGADSVPLMELWWEFALAESQDGSAAPPAALDASKRASEIATKILPADDLKRARILANRADVLQAHGDIAEAEAVYEEVLAVYRKVENLSLWAPIAYNAADLYRQSGDCPRALPLLHRLIELSDAGEIERGEGASARGALGICQVTSGQFDDGIKNLDAATTAFAALGSDDFVMEFELETAKAWWNHGDHARAKAHALKAEAALHDDVGFHHDARLEAEKYIDPNANAPK